MLSKITEIVVNKVETKDAGVKNQRSQCRTTHKRQDC